MKKINVNLGERSYPILIGEGLSNIGKHLKNKGFSRKLMVVSNPVVSRLYFKALKKSLQKAGFEVKLSLIPDGEKYKTLDSVAKLYSDAASFGLDRRSVVVALGGGVVGDICGFFAATYMRGIPFVQAPTTLLAMVDSSVGGKTGVDIKEGKNLAGAFYQPKLVLIDTAVLKTLPLRELKAGMAEVIKYGVIKDRKLFNFLNKNISSLYEILDTRYQMLVSRCVQIKASVVEKDEKETKGLREILNFGHTFGHALETLTGYKTFKHGEAVAIGMCFACGLAVKLKMLSITEKDAVEALIKKAGLPVSFNIKKYPAARVLAVMAKDKKVIGNRFRFVLPRSIGRVEVMKGVSLDILRAALSSKM